jgi:hypothetical protein
MPEKVAHVKEPGCPFVDLEQSDAEAGDLLPDGHDGEPMVGELLQRGTVVTFHAGDDVGASHILQVGDGLFRQRVADTLSLMILLYVQPPQVSHFPFVGEGEHIHVHAANHLVSFPGDHGMFRLDEKDSPVALWEAGGHQGGDLWCFVFLHQRVRICHTTSDYSRFHHRLHLMLRGEAKKTASPEQMDHRKIARRPR